MMKNVIFLAVLAVFCMQACKTEATIGGCDTQNLPSIDFNGTLYVQPVNSPGFTDNHNWQGAVDYCSNLDFNGCDDWYLPSNEELNALYQNQSVIGDFAGVAYWSSTISPSYPDAAYMLRFDNGNNPPYWEQTKVYRCRCVRR